MAATLASERAPTTTGARKRTSTGKAAAKERQGTVSESAGADGGRGGPSGQAGHETSPQAIHSPTAKAAGRPDATPSTPAATTLPTARPRERSGWAAELEEGATEGPALTCERILLCSLLLVALAAFLAGVPATPNPKGDTVQVLARSARALTGHCLAPLGGAGATVAARSRHSLGLQRASEARWEEMEPSLWRGVPKDVARESGTEHSVSTTNEPLADAVRRALALGGPGVLLQRDVDRDSSAVLGARAMAGSCSGPWWRRVNASHCALHPRFHERLRLVWTGGVQGRLACAEEVHQLPVGWGREERQ